MPLYDFECKACGQTFEELLRDLDTAGSVICEHCGSGEVERQLSSFHAASSAGAPSAAAGGGGGCCGAGGCGCH